MPPIFVDSENEPLGFLLHDKLSSQERIKAIRKITANGGTLATDVEEATVLICLPRYQEGLQADYSMSDDAKRRHIRVQATDWLDECLEEGRTVWPRIQGMPGRARTPPRVGYPRWTDEQKLELAWYLAWVLPHPEDGGRAGRDVYRRIYRQAKQDPEKYWWVQGRTAQGLENCYKSHRRIIDDEIELLIKTGRVDPNTAMRDNRRRGANTRGWRPPYDTSEGMEMIPPLRPRDAGRGRARPDRAGEQEEHESVREQEQEDEEGSVPRRPRPKRRGRQRQLEEQEEEDQLAYEDHVIRPPSEQEEPRRDEQDHDQEFFQEVDFARPAPPSPRASSSRVHVQARKRRRSERASTSHDTGRLFKRPRNDDRVEEGEGEVEDEPARPRQATSAHQAKGSSRVYHPEEEEEGDDDDDDEAENPFRIGRADDNNPLSQATTINPVPSQFVAHKSTPASLEKPWPPPRSSEMRRRARPRSPLRQPTQSSPFPSPLSVLEPPPPPPGPAPAQARDSPLPSPAPARISPASSPVAKLAAWAQAPPPQRPPRRPLPNASRNAVAPQAQAAGPVASTSAITLERHKQHAADPSSASGYIPNGRAEDASRRENLGGFPNGQKTRRSPARDTQSEGEADDEDEGEEIESQRRGLPQDQPEYDQPQEYGDDDFFQPDDADIPMDTNTYLSPSHITQASDTHINSRYREQESPPLDPTSAHVSALEVADLLNEQRSPSPTLNPGIDDADPVDNDDADGVSVAGSVSTVSVSGSTGQSLAQEEENRLRREVTLDDLVRQSSLPPEVLSQIQDPGEQGDGDEGEGYQREEEEESTQDLFGLPPVPEPSELLPLSPHEEHYDPLDDIDYEALVAAIDSDEEDFRTRGREDPDSDEPESTAADSEEDRTPYNSESEDEAMVSQAIVGEQEEDDTSDQQASGDEAEAEEDGEEDVVSARSHRRRSTTSSASGSDSDSEGGGYVGPSHRSFHPPSSQAGISRRTAFGGASHRSFHQPSSQVDVPRSGGVDEEVPDSQSDEQSDVQGHSDLQPHRRHRSSSSISTNGAQQRSEQKRRHAPSPPLNPSDHRTSTSKAHDHHYIHRRRSNPPSPSSSRSSSPLPSAPPPRGAQPSSRPSASPSPAPELESEPELPPSPPKRVHNTRARSRSVSVQLQAPPPVVPRKRKVSAKEAKEKATAPPSSRKRRGADTSVVVHSGDGAARGPVTRARSRSVSVQPEEPKPVKRSRKGKEKEAVPPHDDVDGLDDIAEDDGWEDENLVGHIDEPGPSTRRSPQRRETDDEAIDQIISQSKRLTTSSRTQSTQRPRVAAHSRGDSLGFPPSGTQRSRLSSAVPSPAPRINKQLFLSERQARHSLPGFLPGSARKSIWIDLSQPHIRRSDIPRRPRASMPASPFPFSQRSSQRSPFRILSQSQHGTSQFYASPHFGSPQTQFAGASYDRHSPGNHADAATMISNSLPFPHLGTKAREHQIQKTLEADYTPQPGTKAYEFLMQSQSQAGKKDRESKRRG